MARIKIEPKITSLAPDEMPADSAASLYKDKAGANRLVVMTEGGANLASMLSQHDADEAVRLAKEVADAEPEQAAPKKGKEK